MFFSIAPKGRACVPGMGLDYRGEMNSTEPMVVTVAKMQGRTCEGHAERSRSQSEMLIERAENAKRVAHSAGSRLRSHLISGPPAKDVTPVWLIKRDQWGRASGGQDSRCGRWRSRYDQGCALGAKRAAMVAIWSKTGSTLSITASLASFGASVCGELSN